MPLPDYPQPVYNLTAGIWHVVDPTPPPVTPPDVTTLCNLAYGRRVASPSTGGTGEVGIIAAAPTLLMPVRTDIRGPIAGISFDWVEVPQGSGRWYVANCVDDIGKGFPNEHRAAVIQAAYFYWPVPHP